MEEGQIIVSVGPTGLRILRQKISKVKSSRHQKKTTLNACSYSIQFYLKKQTNKKSQNSKLTLFLEQLKREQKTLNVTKRKEIIKIRAELNEKELKQCQRSIKLKPGSLKR